MNMTTIPPVAEEMDALRKYAREELIPGEVLRVIDAFTDQLLSSGLAERILIVGQTAPDFTLPDERGEAVRLYPKLEAGPVVVVFYRGGWCPYCSLHLRAFQRLLPEFQKAGATLLAISPQLPDASLSTREKAELEFSVLSDVGNRIARQFGLVFKLPRELLSIYKNFGHELAIANGAEGAEELPVPAVFVIGADQRVHYARADIDYTHRAEPAEVLGSAQKLSPLFSHSTAHQ